MVGVEADGTAVPEVFRASERTDNAACLLTRSLVIVRTNPAWKAFAAVNGADPAHLRLGPGVSILDVMPDPLREFYASGFASTLASGLPWEHDYESSSADEFRTFRMIVYPQGDYLVVTHTLHVARPHDREVQLPSGRYVAKGLITMCCHCRRVRAASEVPRWDWVPAWVAEQPLKLSHGLCPTCSVYHYPSEA